MCLLHPPTPTPPLPSPPSSSNQIQQKMLYFKTERYLKYVESSGQPSPTPTLSRSCLKFEKFWNAEIYSKFWKIQKYSVSAGLIRKWVIAVLSYPHLKTFLVLAVNYFGRVPQGGRVVYGLSLSTFRNLTDSNSPTHQNNVISYLWGAGVAGYRSLNKFKRASGQSFNSMSLSIRDWERWIMKGSTKHHCLSYSSWPQKLNKPTYADHLLPSTW